MISLPTLYKRTKTGAIQEWTMHIDGGKYWSVSGQTTGKKTVGSPTEVQGKNIGKKNETSPAEQAEAEARARWQKKKDEGYGEDIDVDSTVDPLRVFPMLANTYEEHKQKIVFPVYVQPKLDGLRCIITREGVYSRGWKPFVTVSHIHEACKWLFHRFPYILAFDGELYAAELCENFEKIVSLIKRPKPTEADLTAVKAAIRYHVYDYKDVDDKIVFGARYTRLREALDALPRNTLDATIVPVDTALAPWQDEMDRTYNQYMELGYEGQMIRDAGGVYTAGRSDGLLKRKEFVEEDCEIIGHEEGTGSRTGCIVFRLRAPNGAEYDSTPGDMTVPQMQYLWSIRDTLMGWTAVVKRQQGYTRTGKARFNNTIRLRSPDGEPFVFPLNLTQAQTV